MQTKSGASSGVNTALNASPAGKIPSTSMKRKGHKLNTNSQSNNQGVNQQLGALQPSGRL